MSTEDKILAVASAITEAYLVTRSAQSVAQIAKRMGWSQRAVRSALLSESCFPLHEGIWCVQRHREHGNCPETYAPKLTHLASLLVAARAALALAEGKA